MVLLGEVLEVIGAESRMPLHRHLVVRDEVEVEVSDGGETGTGIVTMITGGYRHPERIVTPHPPGVVGVVAAAGTVGEGGEGRETRDLVVHPAETPDTIERALDRDEHMRRGVLCGLFT